VAAVRKLVRDAIRPAPAVEPDREEIHNRRANATIVQDVTTDSQYATFAASATGESDQGPIADNLLSGHTAETENRERLRRAHQSEPLSDQLNINASSTEGATAITTDLTLLQDAAAALLSIASRAESLPSSVSAQQAIRQIEQVLIVLRRALGS